MTTYSIFIDDDRYSTPTLQFVVGGNDSDAFAFAMKYLLDSPHHQAVRVDQGGQEVFVRSRRDLPAAGGDPRRV